MAFQEQLRATQRVLEGVDALVMRKLEMYEDHLEDKDEGIGVGVLVLLAVHELVQRRHGGRPLQQHRLHPMRKAEMRSIRRDGLVLWILVQNLCRSHATIFITNRRARIERSLFQVHNLPAGKLSFAFTAAGHKCWKSQYSAIQSFL
jgi:hypothetical protein